MDNFDISAASARAYSGRRFTSQLELEFRNHLRRRFRIPRAGLYLILTLILLLSHWQRAELFGVSAAADPLLQRLTVYAAIPINFLTFLVLLLRVPRSLRSAMQVGAAFTSVLHCVILRSAALDGNLTFPGHLIGVMIVSFAVFGGYSWRRVLIGTLFFATLAVLSELRSGDVLGTQIISIYSLTILSLIAVAGAYTHEVQARLAWLYNRYAAQLARTDALTGLASRLQFNRSFPRLLAQAQRDQRMIAVMMLDLDHFKRINDENGHLAGDEVLRALGCVLRTHIARRPLDLRVRYGGEEVLVVWYDVHEEAVAELAESTLRLIRELRIPVSGRENPLRVTASAGITWLVPSTAVSASDILNKSDELLYAAKARGRNCALTESFESAAA